MVAVSILAQILFLQNIQAVPIPNWATGKWSTQDRAYSRILAEVRPFYGRDGFIDEKLVAEKYVYHVKQYMADAGNSILFMRALAWHEVSLSDGDISRRPGVHAYRLKFVELMQRWQQPIDSVSFVRTMAICILRSTSDTAFSRNGLIGRIYSRIPTDTEFEINYIHWAARNPSVGATRAELLKLLRKQETLEFRKGARRLYISASYKWVARMEKPFSKELTEKSISSMSEYISSLPAGHVNNTPEYRKEAQRKAAALRSYYENW